MRDRLIELIDKAFIKSDDNFGMPNVNQVADYLIANGVILPPCKVGDKIYYPYEYGNKVLEKEVRRIIVNDDMWLDVGVGFLPFENVGKTAFLTKEEAEKCLKEKENG